VKDTFVVTFTGLFVFEGEIKMVTKKNKIETETAQLTFEVKRVGSDYELWRGRSWGDGDRAVVVDTFPNDPNTPAMTENLTDMLIFNAMQKMGVQSYQQLHLFATQPQPVNNGALQNIDKPVVQSLVAELVALSAEASVVILAYGSLVRRMPAAAEREKLLLESLAAAGLTDKVKYLVEPLDHDKVAAPVSRKVREGGQDWVLVGSLGR
jgi:hypothetical protein